MKTIILLIFIMGVLNSQIIGQDKALSSISSKSNSFNLQFGVNQIREMNLIPLVHRGSLGELTFETERYNVNLSQFQVSVLYSRIKTNLEELSKSGNIKLKLNYSYNFRIIQNGKIVYYLGPQTSLCYSFMLFPNWDDSHSYWADYLSFGPNNILSVSLKHEREWFTSLNFSIFSLFSRPDEVRPYKMDDSSFGGVIKTLNSNIEPGFLNRAFEINLKTEYRFPVFVNKREAITFNMDVSQFSRKDEQPVVQIITRIGIKIML
jgi:hypothetical protein